MAPSMYPRAADTWPFHIPRRLGSPLSATLPALLSDAAFDAVAPCVQDRVRGVESCAASRQRDIFVQYHDASGKALTWLSDGGDPVVR